MKTNIEIANQLVNKASGEKPTLEEIEAYSIIMLNEEIKKEKREKKKKMYV